MDSKDAEHLNGVAEEKTEYTEDVGPQTVALSINERKLMWKIDSRVLPPLFALFLLAFLDRTNIGNTRIQGMIKDLKMVGSDYNIALMAFFPTYIVFEVPSNMSLKNLRPSTWLSAIMVLWGIVTIGEGLVRTVGGLYAMRVLLGIFEAGLFPGCVYLISMYYKRFELQWRLSLFFSGSILAGGFGGLFAYALANMAGVAGYGGWRWIFIIEGLITIVVAAIGKIWVANWPGTATFLNQEERMYLAARLHEDDKGATMNRLDKRSLKRIFSDWKIYVGGVMYFGVVNTGYAGSYFIPTIINQLGYSAQAAQVRSIPIYVVAAILSVTAAWITDRMQHRYFFCMLGIVISSIGYILLLAQKNLSVGVRYFALFLVTPGGYITQPIILAWVQNGMAGHYKRAVAAGFTVGFGNLGGIVASNVFLTSQEPRYATGYGTSLGLLWLAAFACTVMFFGVQAENRKRNSGERDHRLNDPDADNLGDDHPAFRFTT